MTNIATFIKPTGWGIGDMRLYRLNPAHVETDYDGTERSIEWVVVSAVNVPSSGPETYIFESTPDGSDVVDWGELEGSYRGGMDHEAALAGMGYEVAA